MKTLLSLILGPHPEISGADDAGLLLTDGLAEAQLLHVRIDVPAQTVGLMLDLRVSLQRPDANTGVFFVQGVSSFQCALSEGRSGRTSWNVVGSSISDTAAGVQVTLSLYPDGEVSIFGRGGSFSGVTVAGMEEIPDYQTSSDAEFRAATPDWHSDGVVVFTTEFGAASRH